MSESFKPFASKMSDAGLPELSIEIFREYYLQLSSGQRGQIPESSIDPVDSDSLRTLQNLGSYETEGKKALKETVMIKLNGGLGTSMGLSGPKSLLCVKDNLSFLDITIRQSIQWSKEAGGKVPLIFMNSFNTDQPTRKVLQHYPELGQVIPCSFIHHKYPKILQDTMAPASYPDDPTFEWNPAGHGDLYASFFSTGILDQLLMHGYRYAFISNIDNLGATMSLPLLGYIASHKILFVMEVLKRTEMDRKGGHLARLKNGQLILREFAQTPATELEAFQDIRRYRCFNTNNIWINLEYVKTTFPTAEAFGKLPMITNSKNLVPTDPKSPKIFQVETAVGSAISLFAGAEAVMTTTARFMPVKKCENLILLWSDYYIMNNRFELSINSQRTLPPIVLFLDDEFYTHYDAMKERFPQGAPSLVNCRTLRIEGDVRFGKDCVLSGEVSILNRSGNPVCIPDGKVFTDGEYNY